MAIYAQYVLNYLREVISSSFGLCGKLPKRGIVEGQPIEPTARWTRRYSKSENWQWHERMPGARKFITFSLLQSTHKFAEQSNGLPDTWRSAYKQKALKTNSKMTDTFDALACKLDPFTMQMTLLNFRWIDYDRDAENIPGA